MDLLRKSEEFYHFLNSLTHAESREKVFLEEYGAFVLPPGSTTPFSDVVGQRLNPTVIFNKSQIKSGLLNEETPDSTLEEFELSTQTADSILSSSRDGLTTPLSGGHPLPVISHKVVSIGQPLTSKIVYLTNLSPHHEHQSDILGRTQVVARDSHLSPLPLGSARFILSLYSLGSWKAKEPPPPDIWIICAKNKQNIVSFGCVYDATNSALCIITVKEHSESQELTPLKKFSGAAFSEYEITTTDGSTMGGVPLDTFILQFVWSDSDIGVLSPPPENSDAVLKISNTPGHLFSSVLPLFEELKSLHHFCQIVSGEAKWLGCEDEDILISSDKTAQSVKRFIEEMSHPLANSADVTVISPVCSHMIYEPRIDLDFVERLWVFSRSLTSYGELQLVFAEAFKAVILGKIQPFIHKKSSSTLSELLRQVLVNRDREKVQDVAVKLQLLLSEARLVPCLIQIGLEKVKRDQWSFLVGAGILSSDHFEQFFGPNEHLSQLEQCIVFCKLHNIIELDASLLNTINLPSPVLSTFTKAVMEVYKRDTSYQPFSQSPIFSLSLPAYSPALKAVVALCSKRSPDTWRVTAQEDCGQQRDYPVPCKVNLKRSKPLLSNLQKIEDLSDQHYSYEATCEFVPVHKIIL